MGLSRFAGKNMVGNRKGNHRFEDAIEEAFSAEKMEASIEKNLFKYAKNMEAIGMGGITPTFLAEAITKLKKVSSDLPKWVKHHIKA